MFESTMNQTSATRKPYGTPEVVYESVLEVRAGSPLGIPDPLDPTGTGQN